MLNSLKPTRTKTLVLSALVLLSAAAPPLAETVFKSRDHQKLGKLIGKYYEAKDEGSGISDALTDLDEAIDKLMKKQKGSFLAMVEDLQQSIFLSREFSDSVPKGRITDESLDNLFEELPPVEFAIHVPKSYKSSKGPYPLFLCFADAGKAPAEGEKDDVKKPGNEDPETHLKKNWLDSDLLGNVIFAVVKLPADEASWQAIRGGIGNAMTVLGHMKKNYAVDGNQVFAVGAGKSVESAMRLAAVFPDLFAGVIGRAGDMGSTQPTNFGNIATYFAGGGANCTAFQKAAKELGNENCTIKADGSEADIWEWVQNTRRNPHPLEITISPIEDVGRNAYWLSLIGFDPAESPKLHATIDRATNTIKLEGTGIESVNVLFNDALVDLGQKVTVDANGIKQTIELNRRLDFALDWCWNVGDRNRVYVNQYKFDLPEKTSEDG